MKTCFDKGICSDYVGEDGRRRYDRVVKHDATAVLAAKFLEAIQGV